MPKKQKASFVRGGRVRRRGYGWKEWTSSTVKSLGTYGEQLIAKLLDGEPAGVDCDIYVPKFDAAIEVKVASDSDGVKLRDEQTERQLRLLKAKFPYPRRWCAFVKYHNKSPRDSAGETHRLFQQTVHSDGDIPPFLKKEIAGVYLFDLRIVEAIRRKHGARVVLVRENGRFAGTAIGWRFLEAFRVNPKREFRTLGLDPRKYNTNVRHISMQLSDVQFEFEFLAVLQERTIAAKLQKQLSSI